MTEVNVKSETKKKLTFQFNIQFLEIINLPEVNNDKVLFVSWMRGQKKNAAGESFHNVVQNQKVNLADGILKADEPTLNSKVSLECRFTAKKSEMESKNLALVIKDEKKGKSLYKLVVNLSDYINESKEISKVIEEQLQNKNGTPSILKLRIHSKLISSVTKTSTPSLLGKLAHAQPQNRLKIQYTISFLSVDNLKLDNGTELYISWTRGSKKQNTGKSNTTIFKQKTANWDSSELPIKINCTLIKNQKTNQYSSKKISFTVHSIKGRKTSVLAKTAANLADFTEANINKEVSFNLKNKSSKNAGALKVKVETKWLSVGGKKLIETSGGASNVDPSRTMEINGVNYLLQTENEFSDISEISEEIKTSTEGSDDDEDLIKSTESDFVRDPDDPFSDTSSIKSSLNNNNNNNNNIPKSVSNNNIINNDNNNNHIDGEEGGNNIIIEGKEKKKKSKFGKLINVVKGKKEDSSEKKPSSQPQTSSSIPNSHSNNNINQSMDKKVNSNNNNGVANNNISNSMVNNNAKEVAEFDDEDDKKINEYQTKIKKLSQTLENLEREVAQKDQEIQDMKNKISSSEKLQRSEDQLDRLKKEHQNLKEEVHILNLNFNQKMKEMEDKFGKIDSQTLLLQFQIQSKKEEIERLQEEKQILSNKSIAFGLQSPLLKETTDKLLANNSNKAEDVQQKLKQISELYEHQLKVKEIQLSELEKSNQSLLERKKKLEADHSSLQQKLSVISKKVADIQKLKNSPKIGDSREIILRKIEDLEFIQNNIYRGSPKFDLASKEAKIVPTIVDTIESHIQRDNFLKELLIAIDVSARGAGEDNEMVAYWLSLLISLFKKLQKKKISSGNFFAVLEFDNLNFAQFDNLKSSKKFTKQITSLTLYKSYSYFIQNIYSFLDRILEYAFITGNTAILDKEFASLPDPSKSIQRVIEMLSDTLSIFQNSYSEPVVIQQCFHQVFYYISASLFNLVLQKKNYCTAKTGFRIKMAISLLETWLVDANNSTKGLLSSIRKHLGYIIDMSNILTLSSNQNIFRSKEVIGDTFPSLSLYQIKIILEAITPDKLSAPNLRNIVQSFPRTDKSDVILPQTITLYEVLRIIHPKDSNSDSEDD